MFDKHNTSIPTDLIPWYLNRSLTPEERRAVEAPLRADAHARRTLQAWQHLRGAAVSQPVHAPSPQVKQRIFAQAHAAQRTLRLPNWLIWISGLALILMVLIGLWNVVRPGIGLQWSVSGGSPAAFRIYRAPLGSDRFELVNEIPARPNVTRYTFVDTTLWPGQAYAYRVETIDHAVASPTITADGADVLPTQLAIVLSSLIIGAAAIYVLRELAASPRLNPWKLV